MKLLWSERAQQDVLEIGRFIARDNPSAATDWVAKAVAQAEHVRDFPLVGRRVPEVPNSALRELIFGNHRLVYLVQESEVTVVTLFERHRRFPDEIVNSSDDP
ncbi:MAG: type II toxin-antitoxin system RelE/ParE family toxin [bacterium]